MAEEQALGTPSSNDPCTKRCLDTQSPLNPAVLKPALSSSTAASTVSALCSSSSSVISPSTITTESTTATNRCAACRKRVGLTGFRCRCGSTYCGGHRYPEKHWCEYDYKMAGREQIRRQNPIVVAEKLQKI